MKVPVATTISLVSYSNEEYYAVVIPEDLGKKTFNCLWIFRKGCGMAYCSKSKLSYKDDPMLTIDGIKTLDLIGTFDDIKEMLIEVE